MAVLDGSLSRNGIGISKSSFLDFVQNGFQFILGCRRADDHTPERFVVHFQFFDRWNNATLAHRLRGIFCVCFVAAASGRALGRALAAVAADLVAVLLVAPPTWVATATAASASSSIVSGCGTASAVCAMGSGVTDTVSRRKATTETMVGWP